MKKSELRQIIKEELLIEESLSKLHKELDTLEDRLKNYKGGEKEKKKVIDAIGQLKAVIKFL